MFTVKYFYILLLVCGSGIRVLLSIYYLTITCLFYAVDFGFFVVSPEEDRPLFTGRINKCEEYLSHWLVVVYYNSSFSQPWNLTRCAVPSLMRSKSVCRKSNKCLYHRFLFTRVSIKYQSPNRTPIELLL